MIFVVVLSVPPACRCHANCLIIISDTFITGGGGTGGTLYHVHLLPLFGLYGKYRGLGIFPSIVIDMTETNLVYLSQFLLHDITID